MSWRRQKENKDIINVLKIHGVLYTVKIPGRVTDTCDTAIDNIITNIGNHLYNIECLIIILSNHDGQL